MSRAIALRRAMLERFPDDKESMYVIGDYAYHAEDLKTARTYLERALEIDPRHERAQLHLIWTETAAENSAAAATHARRYLRQPPSDGSHIFVSAALMLDGALEEAVAAVREGVAQHPQSATAIVDYAIVLSAIGDHEAARREAERLRSLPEAQRRGSYESVLSVIAMNEGRYREAADLQLREAEMRTKNGLHHEAASSLAQRAHTLARAGRVDEARKAIAEVLARKDDVGVNVRGSALSVYIVTGDIEQAEAVAGDAPVGAPAFRRLINAAARLHAGDGAGAVEAIRGPMSEPTHHWMWVKALLAAGQYDEAARRADRMRFPWPTYGLDIRDYFLGRAEEGRGNRAAAKAHYEPLLKRWRNADPDLPELVDAKARLAKL